MVMKRIILTALILLFATSVQAEIERTVYMNDDVPANAGAYNRGGIERIGNEYSTWDSRTQSYTTYTTQGNQVYASDGYSYTTYGNGTFLQNNSNGRTYQRNGDTYEPLY